MLRDAPFTFAFLVIAAWTAAPATAQRPESAPASRESAPESRPGDFTPAGMTARIRALVPEIEKVLGRELGAPPLEVVASGREEVAALAFEQSTMLVPLITSELADESQETARRFRSRSTARILAGLVDGVTGRIHVVPENFKDDPGQDLLDVILIHEAVHVFQNRKLGLGRLLGAVKSLDDFLGLQALAEGHAEFVTRRVAARVGLGAAFDAEQHARSEIPDMSDDPSAEQAARAVVDMLTFAYVEGEKFVRAVVGDSPSAEAIDALFRAPPRSQHTVRNPSEYGTPAGAVVDPAEMGERLRRLLPRGYRTDAFAAVDAVLRNVLSILDAAVVDDVLAGYRGGTMVRGRPRGESRPEAAYFASLFRWTSPEAAAKWFDASVQLLRKRDEAVGYRVEAAEYGERETIDGITFLFVTKKIDMGSGSVVEAVEILGLKDTSTAEVSTVGIRATKQELMDLARRAFTEVLEPRPAAPADVSRTGEAETRATLPATATIQGELAYEGEAAAPAAFSIRFWSLGDEARPWAVAQGRDGRFAVELPTRVPVYVGLISADGERYDDQLGAMVGVAPGTTVRFRIKRPEVVELVVHDAATGLPVEDARVYRTAAVRFGSDRIAMPTKEELRNAPLRSNARGSVSFKRDELLAEEEAATAVLVVSPAHAWQRLELPREGAVPREIKLKPGGALRITVANWAALEEASVALQRCEIDDRKYDFSYPDDVPTNSEDGRFLLEGIEPGFYGVLVLRGHYFKDGALYGSAFVEVRRGETAEVAITGVAGPMGVPVKGSLQLGEEYSWIGRTLDLSLVGSDAATKGPILDASAKLDPKTRRAVFELPRVLEGRWKLIVSDVQWVADIEIRAGVPIALEVPPPGDLEVKVIDAEGRVVTRPKVTWSASERHKVWNEGIPGRWDDEAQLLRLKAAPGTGTLRVEKRHCKSAKVDLTLNPGVRVTQTVVLPPAAELMVRIQADGKPYREAAALITIQQEPGSAPGTFSSPNIGGRVRFVDLDAGMWNVEIEKIPGFKTVPPLTARAELGKTTELTIDLEKEE